MEPVDQDLDPPPPGFRLRGRSYGYVSVWCPTCPHAAANCGTAGTIGEALDLIRSHLSARHAGPEVSDGPR